ncbi:MAG: stage II sporulation protein P [Bacillota bacterium]|nr:stage II sporulation protein P [Bacillota bacterium]
MGRRRIWALVGVLFGGILLFYRLRPGLQADRREGFHTLYVGSSPFLHTEILPQVGDRFLSREDEVFEVVAREGQKAHLVSRGLARELYGPLDASALPLDPLELPVLSLRDLVAAFPRTAPKNRLVVIYHSHTDESYIPARGTESEERGGAILKVGEELKHALLKEGFTHVVHDLTNFWPHDEGSYARSRRAVLEYLQEAPLFLFDLHRDAGPSAEVYRTSWNGRTLSQIMMVVGKGNPFYADNLTFARSLMSRTDALYPDLIKGIYLGEGTYNQDLSPGALLLEVGNQLTPLEEARAAMDLLARGLSRWVEGLVP